MKRLVLVLGALSLFEVQAEGAEAAPRNAVYALIIGVNRGVDVDLPPLHYADDDAVRYQELFRALGARTALLTRLDGETTALSPQAAAEALPPTRAALRNVVASLAAEIRTAHQRGVRSTLYVLYAGHGNVDEQSSYVTLEDARLSPRLLAQEILDPIAADANHLIVDACYSYLLVGERGPGGERRKVEGFAAMSELGRRNDLGLLLSTSSGDESHEWGAFQAGIFSHEVRSGLYGAADLDGDGSITYVEMASFLARANQPVVNEKFRPRVFARAPSRSTRLLDLKTGLSRSLDVDGNLPSAHYLIENPQGVRFVDFHNAPGRGFRLVRPGGASPLYLRRMDDGWEATVPLSDERVALASLPLSNPHVVERGAAHQAFSLIFSLPFDGVAEGLVVVPQASPPTPSSRLDTRKVILWSSGAVAAAGVVTGAALLFDASRLADEGRNATQQVAATLNDGIHGRNVGATIAFSVAGAAAITAIVARFWPAHKPAATTAAPVPQLTVGWGQVGLAGRF
jgi:hypothetical protein